MSSGSVRENRKQPRGKMGELLVSQVKPVQRAVLEQLTWQSSGVWILDMTVRMLASSQVVPELRQEGKWSEILRQSVGKGRRKRRRMLSIFHIVLN